MDFLNDKKNSAILIVVAVLLIGCAVGSCLHFMGASSAQPLVVTPGEQPQGNSGMPGPATASRSGSGMPGASQGASGMPGPSQSSGMPGPATP